MKSALLLSTLLLFSGCATNQPIGTHHAADPADADECCGTMPTMAMRYGKSAAITPATQQTSAKYTCPMDPDVVRDQPGSCPKCGMKLVHMKTGDKHDHQ